MSVVSGSFENVFCPIKDLRENQHKSNLMKFNKNIFILNEFRMISDHKRTQIEIESFSNTKEMAELIFNILKRISIEDMKIDSNTDLSSIQNHIAKRLVGHIVGNILQIDKLSLFNNNVTFTNAEGKTFKISCLFGQNEKTICYCEKK
jgi:hypothetical protein